MSTQQIIQSWENGVEPYKIKVRNPDATQPKHPKGTDFPSLLVSEENKRRTHQRRISGV